MEVIGCINPKQKIATTNNVYGKPSENTKIEKNDQKIEPIRSKNVIEGGKFVVEQYDRHGKLIRKTPPGYLPPGEKI